MRRLYDAIAGHLRYAVDLGRPIYEHDFYGNRGRHTYDLIGRRPDCPCPVCGALIREIKTGSTRSYICETCQQ